MPQVNPITITVDAVPLALAPIGGNGSGSMSYRSADRHFSAVLTPKPGSKRDDPNRLSIRFNAAFDMEDHLTAESVERAAFGRSDFTLHPDVTVSDFLTYYIEILQNAQTQAAASGETFW